MLSIVAALSGATTVRAIDIAAEAVAATAANAALNDVADRIEVDDVLVDQIEGTYDVVVANILAPVLIASAADLTRLIGSDGTLIISGILADAHQHVVAALAPLGGRSRRRRRRAGPPWCFGSADRHGMPAPPNRLSPS